MSAAALAGTYRFHAVTLVAGSPGAPAAARRAVRDTLGEWDLKALADDVELCASELVGNAVRHATAQDGRPGRRIVVALRHWPRWLFVEVADEDPHPPMLPAGDPLGQFGQGVAGESSQAVLAESGRGLFIVQSLADATWWAPREQGGKSVFCRFDLGREAAA
jgi:anti-sigma regulatory factor (Ser/Thr protein kinase)